MLFHMIIYNYYFNTSIIIHNCIYMFVFFSQLQFVVMKKYLFINLIFSSHLELNTITILPSLLACACIKVAIKGLSKTCSTQLDELLMKLIHCEKTELIYTQQIIEQFFQLHLNNITPPPKRRCLAPIDTSPQQNQRTKVK